MTRRWSVPTRRMHQGLIALMLSAGALATASAMSGCAGDGLVYDTYWHDTHRWNRDDDRFYRRWEIETRRAHSDSRRTGVGAIGRSQTRHSGAWEAPVGGIRTPLITRPVRVPAPPPGRTHR